VPEQNKDLRAPCEWESHEGIRVANKGVYRVDGRTEETLIDYDTWKDITRTLTVQFLPEFFNRITTDTLAGK